MKEKNLTLLIMAAGMGSRFGGLKQIEPVGPNDEFIIDYSVYDAIKAGFNKIVFIIKKENYDVFKETIGKRVEDKIKVEYAFQDLNDLPAGYTCPEDRVKPWGTAHAILSAKNLINEPFAIINSDDFYGRDAYNTISNFLKEEKEENTYAVVGYHVINTLTENGAVKRGVCKVDGNKLEKLVESSVIKENGIITATPLDGSMPFEIKDDTYVSMNMLGFNPSIFPYIEKHFPKFLDNNKDNILKCEYLIPDVLAMATAENYAKTLVIPTTAKWEGVTYKEDKESVVNAINELIKDGVYPQNLWKK